MVPSFAWDINDFTNFILYSFAINRVPYNYNENHPHSALGYRSPREDRPAGIVNLRYKSCPEMAVKDQSDTPHYPASVNALDALWQNQKAVIRTVDAF